MKSFNPISHRRTYCRVANMTVNWATIAKREEESMLPKLISNFYHYMDQARGWLPDEFTVREVLWEFIWEPSEIRLVGGGEVGVIGYYHRRFQRLSQLNSLLHTTLWHTAHRNSTQTSGEHYWLCSEPPKPEAAGYWKDSNTVNLHRCNKYCRCRNSNRGPSSWEFTVLAPKPSWLDLTN